MLDKRKRPGANTKTGFDPGTDAAQTCMMHIGVVSLGLAGLIADIVYLECENKKTPQSKTLQNLL